MRKLKNLFNDVLNEEKDRIIISEIVRDSFRTTVLAEDQKLINDSVTLLKNNRYCDFYQNLYETAEMKQALLDICVLTFSTENTKLGGSVVTFSLPAGWTCPFAHLCLKKVERERKIDPAKVGTTKKSRKTGKEVEYKGEVVVSKGEEAEFDCFAANQEMQYDELRANRWHNYDLLKSAGEDGGSQAQADLIVRSLQYFFDTEGSRDEVRIHESGDFYNGEYFLAWIETARRMPNVKFYAYTKSIPFVKKYKEILDQTPNLSITLSIGGKRDRDIESLDIKASRVFETPEDVLKAGLIVDLDDSLAKEKGGHEKDFALIVHGTQKAGEMSLNKNRNETFMAYWKYREKLNRRLGFDPNHRLSTEEAMQAIKYIDDALQNPEEVKLKKMKKTDLEFIKKLLNYVVKYNKYNFSEDLVNILPEKYKP